MTEDQSAHLDHLLACWHAWMQADRGVRGFNNRAVLIGDTRAMRVQYESQLERQDDEHDALQCRQIHHEVGQMEDPHRTAIFMDARNIANGLAVWNSPRLPRDPQERAVVVHFARVLLVQRLVSAGVMEAAKNLLRYA